MHNDMRVLTELRRLIRYHPKATFTSDDLADIVNNRTTKVYDRLGILENKPKPDVIPSGDIVANKNKFLGKETYKRSFTETPADGNAWSERISETRSRLGLSHDEPTQNDLIIELKRLRNKSKSTLKAINLTKGDIDYLLSVIPKEDERVASTKAIQKSALDNTK